MVKKWTLMEVTCVHRSFKNLAYRILTGLKGKLLAQIFNYKFMVQGNWSFEKQKDAYLPENFKGYSADLAKLSAKFHSSDKDTMMLVREEV